MPCRGPLCNRPARPGRTDGLCNAHRMQANRGRDLTPLRAYVVRSPRALRHHPDAAAVLADLSAFGSTPYDRLAAAVRLGWSDARRVGKALAVLVARGLVRALPRRLLRRTWKGLPVRSATPYEVVGHNAPPVAGAPEIVPAAHAPAPVVGPPTGGLRLPPGPPATRHGSAAPDRNPGWEGGRDGSVQRRPEVAVGARGCPSCLRFV